MEYTLCLIDSELVSLAPKTQTVLIKDKLNCHDLYSGNDNLWAKNLPLFSTQQ